LLDVEVMASRARLVDAGTGRTVFQIPDYDFTKGLQALADFTQGFEMLRASGALDTVIVQEHKLTGRV